MLLKNIKNIIANSIFPLLSYSIKHDLKIYTSSFHDAFYPISLPPCC